MHAARRRVDLPNDTHQKIGSSRHSDVQGKIMIDLAFYREILRFRTSKLERHMHVDPRNASYERPKSGKAEFTLSGSFLNSDDKGLGAVLRLSTSTYFLSCRRCCEGACSLEHRVIPPPSGGNELFSCEDHFDFA